MAERIDRVSFALDFQKQIAVELALLNEKLSSQLRDEINRVYENSLYTDLEITLKSGSIKTHSCVLQARVPKFYSKYFSKNKSCLYLPDKVNHRLIESFVRSLYSGNDISKEEREIIKKLGNLKNLYKQQAAQIIATPESDVYLTPQASPSVEQRGNSLHTRCLSDSLIDEIQTPQGNLCRNNALYYSLVPVDEVFDSDCSGVLEKELAEQDKLLESFKSIISKERKTIKTRKRNKPTSLTLGSSHATKPTNINSSVQKIFTKRKQDLDSKASISSSGNINNNSFSNNLKQNNNIYSNNFIGDFNKPYNKNSSLQESHTFPPFYVKQIDHNVSISDFNYTKGCGFENRMNIGANNFSGSSINCNSNSKNHNSSQSPKTEPCLKESDDVMSNPETEVIGQDSVLDAGSSGYMTGSSPRDHTVSETYGVDVTEAASSEDIPHDNDRSVASSSVSSDAGTWDSTFPATMEEELTPNVITAAKKNGSSCHLKEGDNCEVQPEQQKYINQQISSRNGSNLPDLVRVDCLENNVDVFKHTQSNHFCNNLSSPTELDVKEGAIPSGNNFEPKEYESVFSCGQKINSDVSSQNNCEKTSNCISSCSQDFVENKNGMETGLFPSQSSLNSLNTNGSGQQSLNNFFIDAASLLDENELVPPPKLPGNSELLFEKIDQKIHKKQVEKDKIELTIVENEQECTDEAYCRLNSKLDVKNDYNSCGLNGEKSSPIFLSPDIENKSIEKCNSENLSFAERRASLIRRNTFELEPDDEKLAVLRQEYERRQGNQLFNESSTNESNSKENQSSKHCENGNDQLNPNEIVSLNQMVGNTSPKKQPPGSLFLTSDNPQKNEDEMHSPDSLNNDNPGENAVFDEKLPKNKESLEKTNNGSTNKLIHVQDIEDKISRVNLESNSNYLSNKTKEQIFNRQLSDNTHDRSQNKSNIISSSSKSIDYTNQIANAFVGSTDRLNKIECMPIVSGGASIIDFSPPVSSASPLMSRRKTEFAPILSGGSINVPEPELKPKPKVNSSFTASWVVDMSDSIKSPEMRKKRTDSTVSSNSSEHSDPVKEDSTNKSEQKIMKCSNPALGFFIPLDDPKPMDKNRSNCNNNNLPKIKSCVSSESTSESRNSSQSNLNSSCGFYIDLNKDNDDQAELKEKTVDKNSILPDKKLFSMFIDISESSSTKSTENGSPKSKTSSPNLFSNKKIKTKSHTNRFFSKHGEEVKPTYDSQLSSESSMEFSEHPEVSKGKQLFGENLNTPPPSRQISTNDNSTTDLTSDKKKGGFFMFIEADSSSPVPRRRTLPSGLRPNYQRHSWNLESRNLPPSEDELFPKKEHKRAHSVSVDKSLLSNVSLDEKKSSSVASLSKNSSKEFSSGLFESGPASMDETAIRFPEKNPRAMISSWHGPVKPSFELQKVIARGERKDIKESKTVLGLSKTLENNSNNKNSNRKINKENSSFDINSENSISCKSDETFNVSNMSDSLSHKEPDDATFIINDVSNIANPTSNELELSTPSHDIVSELSKDDSEPAETDFSHTTESHSDYGKSNKRKDITCILESPHTPDHSSSLPLKNADEENKSSFVKLSDLDKEPAKLVVEQRRTINRMSRSIPETSWIESKMMTRSATSRSLSRIFPHLNVHTPENDDAITDISDNISSMQSSIEPSALEGSTEETDASSSLTGPCSRLGEDLLRMFLDEISPDVTVEVGGRRIKAHKCILSSRCQYFAAMLSGGWVESAGNVISLSGFSYNAVHFALCHIYSGASNIPDSINIVELATLADMLCLEGLKEVIMYTLKVKYCHFFHKPCPMCTVGVLECLPLAAAYGLDEIYRKSLRWITKYFVRVWPTKGFAQLPRELVDKCFKQHVVHMSVENVLETVICCEKLQATIPQVRWADPVFTLTQKLLETAVKYITQHFSGVLSSEMFLSMGKDSTWNLDRLEETLVGSTERLSPDQACRSHSRLHTILTVAESPDPPAEMTWNPEFIAMLRRIASGVESSLIKQAGRAARTPAWAQMEPQLRHRIQDAACLIIIPGDDRRRARHSSLLRRSEGGSSGLRSSDLHQVKVAMTQQNVGKKTANSASNPATTTTSTTGTTATNRISLPNQPAKASPKTDDKTSKTKSWPYKLAEVKSRYLEQRTPVKTSAAVNNVKEKTCSSVPAQRKNPPGKPIISSSDSSRTSSPAMRRSVGPRIGRRSLLKDSPTAKKDVDALTISTDSLVENIQTRPSTSGKTKPKNVNEANEINGNVRTPILGEKSRRNLPNKIDSIKMKSEEYLTKVNGEAKPLKSNSVSGSQNILGKEIGTKLKSSPVPLGKKNISQGSPRVKESPVVSRAKPMVNSTPSPALRRNVILSQSNQQVNQNNQETKGNPIKRTSTYRVQNRSISSPTKAVTPIKTREPLATTSNNKGNINDPRLQKSVNNNKSSPVINRVKQQPQLTVGSRSGTFLKDEPTVMRKIQTADVE